MKKKLIIFIKVNIKYFKTIIKIKHMEKMKLFLINSKISGNDYNIKKLFILSINFIYFIIIIINNKDM